MPHLITLKAGLHNVCMMAVNVLGLGIERYSSMRKQWRYRPFIAISTTDISIPHGIRQKPVSRNF
jgi:hypothetical protein